MRRALGLAMLFALASAYLRLGLFIPIEWVDEGVIVYAIWRVAEGDLPYRDFQQMYPPSLFFLGGFLFRLFGSDLAVLRYLVLATKAATCVMVYVGARRISGRAFALIAYAVAVALLGIAWPILTTPYASFFGAALCLAGLLSFLAFERRLFYGCAIAGLCFGIAATFKQTTGAFAFLALALFLLVDEGQGGSRPGRILATLVRTSRWFVILFTAAVSVFYLAPAQPPWEPHAAPGARSLPDRPPGPAGTSPAAGSREPTSDLLGTGCAHARLLVAAGGVRDLVCFAWTRGRDPLQHRLRDTARR